MKIQCGSGLENVIGKNESARKYYTRLKTFNKRTYCPGEEVEWPVFPTQGNSSE